MGIASFFAVEPVSEGSLSLGAYARVCRQLAAAVIGLVIVGLLCLLLCLGVIGAVAGK